MTIRTALAATALLTAGAALAEPAPVSSTPTTLTVAAEGRVTRAPDIAEVSGGVVTSAPTAAALLVSRAALVAKRGSFAICACPAASHRRANCASLPTAITMWPSLVGKS